MLLLYTVLPLITACFFFTHFVHYGTQSIKFIYNFMRKHLPMNFLLLEDNLADAELIEYELLGFLPDLVLKRVETEEGFIQELSENPPDLIISDYDLPGYSGAAALKEAMSRCPETPFILVTGAVSEDRVIEMLTQGAKDYVLKSRLNRLASAVGRVLKEAQELKARRAAEQEMLDASLYVRSLIEAGLDPLLVISTEGIIIDVNAAAEKMAGIPRNLAIGTDYAMNCTEPEKAREGLKKVLTEGYIRDFPLCIKHVSGKCTAVLCNAATYLDAEGRVEGVVATSRDVTRFRTAEEELRKTAERLAVLNSEMESFSHSVAHDLQAPLRAIGGYARMILKDAGPAMDAETKRRFDVIRENARRMQEMIEGLLALSRVGRHGMSFRRIDMNSLCAEVWNEVVNAFPDAGALFEIGTVPDAYGDKSLIRQVLANLFANALKYSRNSDPAEIKIGSYTKDRSTVYYVRDNGVGFDMSCCHKLFGAFQRLHSASEFEGTGLGLYIAKRIIDRHQGRIWAESALGRGATFYFTLPADGLNS